MGDGQPTGGKILELQDAVRKFVRPEMTLHLAGGIGGPSAAICEIIRQYHGTEPKFELVQSTLTGHATNLLHCGLVKKAVFSVCMEIAGSGHPSKVAQRAYKARQVVFENWSLLSLQQRLMAGAMGLGFMPTRSISGSTMAMDNRESFIRIEDPFHEGEHVGLVKSLTPDLSIVHGCAADRDGNIILAAPYGEDIWGALASREGVVATVEKIVGDEAIARYSSLVKIPGYMVRAICVTPLGIHPFALSHPALEMVSGYEMDQEFLLELHKASSNPETLDPWIEKWVLDCTDHGKYLEKIRKKRPSSESNRKREIAASDASVWSADELVKIVAAREIVESVLKSGHRTMLVGAGSMAAAALLAYHQLLNQGYELELITGNGQIGYRPPAGGASLQSLDVIATSRMLTDTVTTQGVLVGGGNGRCLSVLGAGQVDKNGNINSSRTFSGGFLVGTGGANDAANAREVILVLNQTQKRFVEKLPYITADGGGVTKVVSNLGVFKKGATGELSLALCLPGTAGEQMSELLERIEANCGWSIKTDETLGIAPPPSPEELKLLRQCD